MQTQHTKKYITQNAQTACLVWSKTWAGTLFLPTKLFAQAKTLGGSKIY